MTIYAEDLFPLPTVNPFPKIPLDCKHQDRIPFSKNICRSCYQYSRRKSGSWTNKQKALCHPDQPHVAKGKCHKCYVRDYIKRYNVK